MTTLRETPLQDDLAAALDDLAAAAEQARDDSRTRAVLAAAVGRLEDATGAGLGDPSGDALVVLQRRFGRAHARLARCRTGVVDPHLLHGLARALEPGRAGALHPHERPASAPVLARC